ncbi:MAG TPA: NAD(P)-binding domain-containing protein, partial [Polyangiales bacterium]|nr:NAD(P)-binding domain-containing protein [Polyangiales bacterium]
MKESTMTASAQPSTQPHEIGIVGLGRMGGGLALHAMEQGVRVAGFTLGGADAELREHGLLEQTSITALARALRPPRALFLYIPAGPPVDAALDELLGVLAPDDIVVDGGNSYWGDSLRRAARVRERGIHLVDLGTSGGVTGARNGACFMAGGDAVAVARIEPVLRLL